MYLAVFDHTNKSVLVRQYEGIQRLMYYLSKTLVDTETRYLLLEKIALALVIPRGSYLITSKLTQYGC